MALPTWFIADLHLDTARPAMIQMLLDFLQPLHGNAAALYILGDLFEYWVGDDALQTSPLDTFQPVVTALRQLGECGGVPLYFLHGNRDFLVGETFAALTGCTLLPEQCVVDLYGTPTLLLHGDSLCTDDVDYQQVRKLFRNPQWQAQFLGLPLDQRIRQAEAMRVQSRLAMQGKQAEILDVNGDAVLAAFRTFGVTSMIHGHTHRPAIHTLDCDGVKVQRIVLGDWKPGRPSFLKVSVVGMELFQ